MRPALLALTLALASAPVSAAVMPVHGTLSIAIGTLGGPTITGTGVGSSAGGIGTLLTMPAGLFDLTASSTIGVTPSALGIGLIQIPASPAMPVQNAAGAFAPGVFPNGGSFGGVAAFDGLAHLWIQGTTVVVDSGFSYVTVNCGPGVPTLPGCWAGQLPLRVVGGGEHGGQQVVLFGLPITLIGAAWTNLGANEATPTKTIKIQRQAAGIPMTLTATAYDKRTAGGRGTIQLVAPVSAKLNNGLLGTLPIVGTLTLQYVPEPATLLMVGSGVVAFAAIGRRRSRS